MRLKKIIDSSAHSEDVQMNVITDGERSCFYQEIPALLEQIHTYFTTQNISPHSCIAYECANLLPDALVLLYLMAHDYYFIPLPSVDKSSLQQNKSDKIEEVLDLKPVPQFCKYRLTINHANLIWGEHLEKFLEIEENSHYNGLQVSEAHSLPEGAVYLRTSGSMGTSKITVHSPEKLLTNALNCVERFGLESSDRVAISVPIFHMYGLGAGFLPAIAANASIDLQAKTNILRYLDRERHFDPNVAYLTPTLCDILLQGRKKPRPYKRIVTATQRIKEETFHQFDAQFGGMVNLYGSTELGAIATSVPTDPVERRAVTIKPMPQVILSIDAEQSAEDHDTSTDREIDSASPTGLLSCQHGSGFNGYIDEEGEWIQRISSTDWYETGDIAQKHADGTFQIVGRAKNSINRNGYLVLFADIERAMEKLDYIEQVVVVTASGETRQGERIAAFCLPDPNGPSPDGLEIRKQCMSLMPKYALPDEVQVVEKFPTLPNGKIDQQILMTMVGA